MKAADIETWAFQVIHRVVRGQPYEDDLVEIKSEWPTDHYEASRQIAGLANAARGETVLWLLGLHKTKGVVGISDQEMNTWWPQVAKHFEELAPAPQMVTVPYEDKAVFAIAFETDRVPFTIKNPQFNTPQAKTRIQCEVPWREATGTRTARRSDLKVLLAPLRLTPKIETLEGYLIAEKAPEEQLFWTLYLKLYISPQTDDRIILPFHKTEISLEIPNLSESKPIEDFGMRPYHLSKSKYFDDIKDSTRNAASTTQAIVLDAGMWELKASWHSSYDSGSLGADAIITIRLPLATSGQTASTRVFLPEARRERGQWFHYKLKTR